MEVILANSGARGFYFTLEPRLFSGNNWSPAARATMVALCSLAAESNAIGVFRLHVSDVKMVLESFSFHEKTTTIPSIWRAIRELEQQNCITIHRDTHIFIHGFWGYRGTPSNPKHREGAEKILVSMPPELQEKFRCHYGFNQQGNPIGNGIANAIHQEQYQEQEQYQKRDFAASAADDSALPAKPKAKRTKAERPPLEELEATLTGAFAENWKLYKFAVAQKRLNKSVSDNYLAGLLSEYLASMKKHGYSHDAGASALLSCMRAHTDPPAENERYFRKCCSSAAGGDNGSHSNGHRPIDPSSVGFDPSDFGNPLDALAEANRRYGGDNGSS